MVSVHHMLKKLKKRNTTIEPVKNIIMDVRMAYFMARNLADAMQANWDGVVAAGYEQEYKAVCDLRDQCREMIGDPVNNIDTTHQQ